MVIIDKKMIMKKLRKQVKKNSLKRKLVGYRNWKHRWCKKEGNKVLGKDK